MSASLFDRLLEEPSERIANNDAWITPAEAERRLDCTEARLQLLVESGAVRARTGADDAIISVHAGDVDCVAALHGLAQIARPSHMPSFF